MVLAMIHELLASQVLLGSILPVRMKRPPCRLTWRCGAPCGRLGEMLQFCSSQPVVLQEKYQESTRNPMMFMFVSKNKFFWKALSWAEALWNDLVGSGRQNLQVVQENLPRRSCFTRKSLKPMRRETTSSPTFSQCGTRDWLFLWLRVWSQWFVQSFSESQPVSLLTCRKYFMLIADMVVFSWNRHPMPIMINNSFVLIDLLYWYESLQTSTVLCVVWPSWCDTFVHMYDSEHMNDTW